MRRQRLRGHGGFVRRCRVIGSTASLLCVLIDPVMAADPVGSKTAPTSSPWHFLIAPYAWAYGIYGTVGFGRQSADVHASFLDILEHSDSLVALQGHVEIQYDRFGIFLDGSYADMDASFHGEHFTSDVQQQLVFLETGAFYRVIEDAPLWHPSPEIGGGAISVDALAGARYTYLNANTDNALKVFDQTFRRDYDSTEDWWDPFIGGRLLLGLTKRFDFSLRGDVGGFNVGSDFTWNTQAMLGYHFSMWNAVGEVWAGYRAMGQDYDNGSGRKEFKWDVILHGPILGMTVRW
ncbi:hypothetical protein ACFPL7_03365 [Dongia soli]|uniref:Outer membrane protein beta-barrel domain-containing protein n=1 Tax=Dongia soli TaxID=600628 RepID=A0ABU5EEB2_9PROT|nr:hypothetical protein [Dongia soli]MDY0884671.1 hypothetical protein [Dongia soli]